MLSLLNQQLVLAPAKNLAIEVQAVALLWPVFPSLFVAVDEAFGAHSAQLVSPSIQRVYSAGRFALPEADAAFHLTFQQRPVSAQSPEIVLAKTNTVFGHLSGL